MNILILLPVVTRSMQSVRVNGEYICAPSKVSQQQYIHQIYLLFRDLSSLDMNTPPLNINYVCFGPYLTPEIFSLLSRKQRQLNQI